jgi:hypothetical protein
MRVRAGVGEVFRFRALVGRKWWEGDGGGARAKLT